MCVCGGVRHKSEGEGGGEGERQRGYQSKGVYREALKPRVKSNDRVNGGKISNEV